jgi:hypothetical protein
MRDADWGKVAWLSFQGRKTGVEIMPSAGMMQRNRMPLAPSARF